MSRSDKAAADRRVTRRGFMQVAATVGVASNAAAATSGAPVACKAPEGFVQASAPLRVRRVVTSRDRQGQSKVLIDENVKTITSARAGHHDALVWTSPLPADNADDADGAARPEPRQSVFRVTRYDPGVAPRNHATQTIDYAVVLSGQIDMELDSGTVNLRQGDVLVQRGTVHNWVNRGTEPCVIAFILLEAKG